MNAETAIVLDELLQAQIFNKKNHERSKKVTKNRKTNRLIRFDKKEAITKETEDGHSIENSDLAAAEGKIK